MRAAFLFLALSLVGCGTSKDLLDLGRSAAKFSAVADPLLRAKYGAELRACENRPEEQIDPCITHVRKDWAEIRQGLIDIRIYWCALEPWKCPNDP
jgi:hypothetical protein